MLRGGRGAGMKMSTTQVSKHLWGLHGALGGHLQEPYLRLESPLQGELASLDYL